jgi:formylglycine-generating enzyme required for sulfatase activity
MASLIRWLTLFFVLTIVVVVGCSDDDLVAPSPTGTIIIKQTPSELADGGWTLTGPRDAMGAGDMTLDNMPVGQYTVNWDEVAGWNEPGEEIWVLAAGGTLVLTGIYLSEEMFVHILPGVFMMGSPADEPGRFGYETQHEVVLTQGFYMSKYEVTQEWWYQVMGGVSTTSRRPQTYVSFDMAVQFCNALSRQEELTPAYTIDGPNGDVTWNQAANGYRLPTEAEWEYACRAGSTTAFANGPITHSGCDLLDLNLDALGWYCGNRTFAEGPAPVSLKQANAWQIYDMHGNAWEWVWDGYRADYEDLDPVDPVHNVGPGAYRVLRGGFWNHYAQGCRSARRHYNYPHYEHYHHGFRPVRTAF